MSNVHQNTPVQGRDSMKAVITAASGVLGSVLFFNMANGALHTLVGIRLAELDATETVIGIVTSVFFLGKLTGAMTAEHFVRVIRNIRSFAIITALAGLMTLALPLIPFVALWFVIRFVTGYCSGAQYVVMESWISLLASNENRARTLGVYESTRMLAVTVAPFVISFGTGTETFIIAGCLYIVAIIPVCAFGSSEPKEFGVGRLSLAQVVKAAPLGMASAVASGWFTSAFYGFGAVYAYKQGLSVIEISTLVSVTLLAPAFMHIPLGWMADSIDKRVVILISAVVPAAAAAVIGLGLAESFIQLVVLSATVGAFAQPHSALGSAYVYERVRRDSFLKAVGTVNVVNDLGNVSGPILASLAMTIMGDNGLYAFFSIMLTLLAVLSLADMTQRYDLQPTS